MSARTKLASKQASLPFRTGCGALAIAIGLLITCAGHAATERVGVAAAVNPQAQGIQPGARDRALFIGAQVVHDERIRTGANGRTQVVFLDGSALTIGPNADMVIDEFVYDPDAKVGTLALTAAKGAFRFVGGRISKKKPVVIKTPTAVIGIRGGIALFEVGSSTRATFLFGDQMQVTAGDVTRTVDKPGFAIDVPAGADAPSDPKPAAPASLKEAVVGLEATPQSDTGVAKPPVDQDVASTQLSELSSNRTPTELANASGGQSQAGATSSDGQNSGKDGNSKPKPRAAARSGGLTSFVGGNLVNNLQTVLNTSQMDDTTNTNAANGGNTVGGKLVGRIKSANSSAAAFGTQDALSSKNIGFTGGYIKDGNFNVIVNGSILSLPIGGPGSVTNFFNGSGQLGSGPVSGSSHLHGDGEFAVFELTLHNQNNARATAFAGVPTPPSLIPTSGHTDFALTPDYVLQSNVAFLSNTLGGLIAPLPNAVSGDHGVIIWDISGSANAQRAVGFLQSYVDGSGTGQQSVINLITGQVLFDGNGRPYIAGRTRGSSHLASGKTYFFEGNVSSIPAGDGSHIFGTSGSLHFGLQSATANSNGSTTPSATNASDGAATVSHFANVYANSVTAPQGNETRTTATLTGYAAGGGEIYDSSGSFTNLETLTTTNGNPNSVTISTNKSTNKIQATIGLTESGSSDAIVLHFGDSGGSSGRSVFVDDDGFGAIESATMATLNGNAVVGQRSYIFSDSAIHSSGLLPSGVNFCTCNALRWGFWGTDLKLASGSRLRGHLGTWVAGTISNAASIAGLTGSATYNGHLAGTVVSGTGSAAKSYIAVGGLSINYNFATASGSVNVNSFDSVNYTGTISKLGAGLENRVTGAIMSSSGPTRNGTLSGAFFTSNGQVNGAIGGDVSIAQSGGGYSAAGIFAAHR